MSEAGWGFVGAIFGALVGAIASIATTVVTTRSSARLQARADDVARAEQIKATQRGNLVEVQEALQSVARLSYHAQHHYMMAMRKGAEWGRIMLPDELDENLGAAHRRLSALVERVTENDLRRRLRDLNSAFVDMLMATSEHESQRQTNTCSQTYRDVMTHIGEVFRKYDLASGYEDTKV